MNPLNVVTGSSHLSLGQSCRLGEPGLDEKNALRGRVEALVVIAMGRFSQSNVELPTKLFVLFNDDPCVDPYKRCVLSFNVGSLYLRTSKKNVK